MNKRKWVAAIAVFLLGVAGLSAQDQGAALRQRMRNNLRDFRLIRLTQALNLNEEQTSRIFPVFNRVDKEKQDLQKDLSQSIQELRRLLRNGAPAKPAAEKAVPEAERAGRLAELVRKIGQIRGEIRAKDDALDEFLAKELDPIQQARYILFQIEFNQGMGDLLDRVRGRRMTPLAPVKK